jgi:hypothetical protein
MCRSAAAAPDADGFNVLLISDERALDGEVDRTLWLLCALPYPEGGYHSGFR